MASRWFSAVVDARDHARLARWWAEVLNYRVVREEWDMTFIAHRDYVELYSPEDSQPHPGLLFMRAAESKVIRNSLHIGLTPDDQDSELERLIDMGARHVHVVPKEMQSVVLADPEGNEFCVMSPVEM